MKSITLISVILFVTASCSNNEESTKIESELNPVERLVTDNLQYWIVPESIDTQFVLNDSCTINMKFSNSELILDVEEDSLRKHINNGHNVARAIEQRQIKKNQFCVFRDSADLLNLKLKDSSWFKVIPNVELDEADCLLHKYYEKHGFYSIYVQWYEGSAGKLICANDGETYPTWGKAYFSPNGKYVITIMQDLEAAYSPNGFQVFENQSGILNLLGEYNLTAWGPNALEWIDNSSFLISGVTFGPINNQLEYIHFNLKMEINTLANSGQKANASDSVNLKRNASNKR